MSIKEDIVGGQNINGTPTNAKWTPHCYKITFNRQRPTPNGMPLEFFLANWDIIGETLLQAILEGIASSKLHKRFTKGLLVLLAKR